MNNRKQKHIELTEKAQITGDQADSRFIYEPALAAHPDNFVRETEFLGKTLKFPLFISSITGGTGEAAKINRRLARAAGEFGLAMGLGSCRPLLETSEHLKDFSVRKECGEETLLLANLGIAQLEQLLEQKATDKIHRVVDRLSADGLIIHINPLQEWVQPEGDRLKNPPLETISRFTEEVSYKLVVKEVGQGMGCESLKELMKLPLDALELAAFGGTNFTAMELLRQSDKIREELLPLVYQGRTPDEMTEDINHLLHTEGILCKNFIISGGISNFLDGYYYRNKLNSPSLYGQAGALLKRARNSYEELKEYLTVQREGYAFAEQFLRVKT